MSRCPESQLDPVALRRAFLLAARHLFGHPENYGSLQPALGRFVYSDDPGVSTLPVRLDFDYDPKSLGGSGTPTIWVGMGDMDLDRISVGHDARDLHAMAGTVKVLRARARVAVKCVSRQADEALGLATVAAVHFAGLHDLFMRQLGLQTMQVERVGRPQLVDQAPERVIACDCTIAVGFNFTVNATVEGHRLKALQVALVPLTGV